MNTYELEEKVWGVALIIAAAVTLQACDQKVADTTQASQKLAEPITVKHALGTTVIDHLPQRVAVLDMNEADFLDQLNVPIMGMPKIMFHTFWKNIKRCTNSGFGCNCTAQYGADICIKTRPDFDDAITR